MKINDQCFFFFCSLLYLAHELCEEINFYGDSYALQSIDLYTKCSNIITETTETLLLFNLKFTQKPINHLCFFTIVLAWRTKWENNFLIKVSRVMGKKLIVWRQ